MSYYKLYYHIIFGTRHRQKTIPTEHEKELYAYLYGVITKIGGKVIRINGMSEHVHILTTLPPKISISEAVKAIKQSSSIWLKENKMFPFWGGWAEGYAIKSYSEDEMPSVKEYIMRQKEHHLGKSFDDEYLQWTGESLLPE